jgi:hypothetical protein
VCGSEARDGRVVDTVVESGEGKTIWDMYRNGSAIVYNV